MSAHSLDTYRIVKRLQQAGFSDMQAETVTDVMRETRDFDLSALATKTDVAMLQGEIADLRDDMDKQFAAVRGEMTREIGAVRGDMAKEFAAVRGDMAKEFAAVRDEMAKGFAAVRGEMTREIAAVRGEMTRELGAVRGEMAKDSASLRDEMAKEFASVRGAMATKTDIAELRASMAETKADILKWVIGIILVQGGIVFTLMKLFPGH